MSETSIVQITVRRGDFEEHKQFFKSLGMIEDYLEHAVRMESKVALNAGEWSVMESFLVENRIEYDKWWSDGDSGGYEAGTGYARIIAGEYSYYEIYDSQVTQLELLDTIKELFDQDPQEAYKFITDKMKELHPFDACNLNIYNPNSLRFIRENDANSNPESDSSKT